MNTVRGREYEREEEEGGMKWGETERKKKSPRVWANIIETTVELRYKT